MYEYNKNSMDFKENNLEILSPAGNMERLLYAVKYGADAVYLAGKNFGMRTSPDNFDFESLSKAVDYAHKQGVKIYLTCNTIPRNPEINLLPEFLKNAQSCQIDAFIITDLGVLEIANKYCPSVEKHISTQAGIVNFASANFFYNLGAKRVILSRELSLGEIREIREKVNKNLELEVFVHGAMCMSFSGRCLISSYLNNRDANRGDCSQPCRWKYAVMELNRQGEYFPIDQDYNGTYLFNSKDLCMIEHLYTLYELGVNSIKIEGRAKSSYYVASITKAYRYAWEEYKKYGKNHKLSQWILDEVKKISHREYSKGFYFGYEPGQVYSNGGYVREYEVIAVVIGYDIENKLLKVSQRNKFVLGDTIDVLEPTGEPYEFKVQSMYDKDMNKIEVAPHPMQEVYITFEQEIPSGSFLRRKK